MPGRWYHRGRRGVKEMSGRTPRPPPKGLDAIGQGRAECQQQCWAVGLVWEGPGSDPDPSTSNIQSPYGPHFSGRTSCQPAGTDGGGERGVGWGGWVVQFVWKHQGVYLKMAIEGGGPGVCGRRYTWVCVCVFSLRSGPPWVLGPSWRFLNLDEISGRNLNVWLVLGATRWWTGTKQQEI